MSELYSRRVGPNRIVLDREMMYMPGVRVHELYFHGYGVEHLLPNGVKDDLKAWKPRKDTIYHSCLAGRNGQCAKIGPLLAERGFQMVETSKNPNTERTIELWVLHSKDYIDPEA